MFNQQVSNVCFVVSESELDALITRELVAFRRMKNKRTKRNINPVVCRILDRDMVSLLTNRSK